MLRSPVVKPDQVTNLCGLTGAEAATLHYHWKQVLGPVGHPTETDSTSDIVILYMFSSPRTLQQRFIDATGFGEPVTWAVSHNGTTWTMSGTYWFSDSAADIVRTTACFLLPV